MRTQKIKTLILGLLFMVPALIWAQDDSPQAFWVHEDVVKPSMTGEYEEICKEVIGLMKTHNVQNNGWISTSTSDSRYLYVGPMEKMADLDRSPLAGLMEKLGEEKMGELFGRMDKCYDVQQDYVIYLDKELSYMPAGITQTPEGQNYRRFHYLHYTPANRMVVREKMMAIKDLFVAKGSKVDYRVYRSGFGNRGEYYMVAIAATDPVDYAQDGMDNQKLLGEDGQKVMSGLWESLLKYEEFVGQMRPDLAYSPSN